MNIRPTTRFRSGRLAAAGCMAMLGVAGSTAMAPPAHAETASSTQGIVGRMADLRIAATIAIGKTADWVAVTRNGVWIGSTGPNAVSEIDPATNRVTTIALPGRPCAGLAADERSVWVPLCGPTPKLAKVDIARRALDRVFDVGPAAPEGGIAIGAGSIWLVVDKAGTLARIDPADGRIVQTVMLPAGSYNPVFSDGRIWISRVDGAELTVVDPRTPAVSRHVSVGGHPRFVTTGGGAVWTLNQQDGSLSRVDTAGSGKVSTIALNIPGAGGDVTYADDRVWATLMETPLTIVDAAAGHRLCQWKGAGGDSLGVGHGAVWLTNLRAGTVSRIALADLPEACRTHRSR